MKGLAKQQKKPHVCVSKEMCVRAQPPVHWPHYLFGSYTPKANLSTEPKRQLVMTA